MFRYIKWPSYLWKFRCIPHGSTFSDKTLLVFRWLFTTTFWVTYYPGVISGWQTNHRSTLCAWSTFTSALQDKKRKERGIYNTRVKDSRVIVFMIIWFCSQSLLMNLCNVMVLLNHESLVSMSENKKSLGSSLEPLNFRTVKYQTHMWNPLLPFQTASSTTLGNINIAW